MYALSRVEFEDIKLLTAEQFDELSPSKLTVRYPGSTAAYDPDFNNIHTISDEETLLPYTNVLSSGMKLLDPSGADFTASQIQRVYIPTLRVEQLVPGGKILREKHIIVINDVEHRIKAVVAFPMMHGTSIVYKLYCAENAGAEQDQGDYGA